MRSEAMPAAPVRLHEEGDRGLRARAASSSSCSAITSLSQTEPLVDVQ